MTRKTLLLILSSLLLGASCAPELDGSDCTNGKCDNTLGGKDGQDVPCDTDGLILDFSGGEASLSKGDIAGLSDGIAEHILSSTSETCSLSVADIVEEMTAKGCSDLGTALVSSRSQPLQIFTDYRAVTTMNCGDREVFLHYPIAATEVTSDGALDEAKLLEKVDSSFPAIIAQASNGSFNFYQSKKNLVDGGLCGPQNELPDLDNVQACTESADCNPGLAEGEVGANTCHIVGKKTISNFRYYGNSIDYISQQERHETLAEMSKVLPIAGASEIDIEHTLDIDRNCAGCHPNGGILIKEFDTPWVHWEGHEDNPLSNEIVTTANLGRKTTGATIESKVRSGNSTWNSTRIGLVLEALDSGTRNITTGDLLRPLLCTDEFNIDTATGFRNQTMSSLTLSRAILDRSFGRSSGVSVNTDSGNTQELFNAEIARQGWILGGFLKVAALQGALRALGLTDFGEAVDALGGLIVPRESIFIHSFMERSQIDLDYQDKLLEAGVVDDKLVNALLSIDWTQSMFSEERCGLVSVMERAQPSAYVSALPSGDFVEVTGSGFSSGIKAADGTAANLTAEILRVLSDELGRSGCGGAANCDPEDQLFDLLSADGAVDVNAIASDFSAACSARASQSDAAGEAFVRDYVRYMTQVRHRAAGLNAGQDQVQNKSVAQMEDASFLQWRFPGANGFVMPHAIDGNGLRGYEDGLRFNEDCTMD